LYQKELINYHKIEHILTQIKKLLLENFQNNLSDEYSEIINKCSKALSIILRPIKMVDQFKTRMDLVMNDKLKSEDIAKLTSLKNKSHYDVLRERFFFQYLIEWQHEIHMKNKSSY